MLPRDTGNARKYTGPIRTILSKLEQLLIHANLPVSEALISFFNLSINSEFHWHLFLLIVVFPSHFVFCYKLVIFVSSKDFFLNPKP